MLLYSNSIPCHRSKIISFQRDLGTNQRSEVFTSSAQPLQKHPYIQKYGVIKTANKSCQSYKDSDWPLKQTALSCKWSLSIDNPLPQKHQDLSNLCHLYPALEGNLILIHENDAAFQTEIALKPAPCLIKSGPDFSCDLWDLPQIKTACNE